MKCFNNYEILKNEIGLNGKNCGLTHREVEILILISAGFENSSIAKIFYVTIPTIKKRIQKIYKKIGANNRANAVFRANNLGVFSINDFFMVIFSDRVRKFMIKNKINVNNCLYKN